MKIGTKSLLFGTHQFLLHPLFVLWGWVKLYGWPKDWRIYIAILVHDWGYWGKADMDGLEGRLHPLLGAAIMERLFDRDLDSNESGMMAVKRRWYYFTVCHSRFYAQQHSMLPSRLCWADKLGFTLYPEWLYLLLARLSGELWEYMTDGKWAERWPWPPTGWELRMIQSGWPLGWLRGIKAYTRRLVEQNKDKAGADNKL